MKIIQVFALALLSQAFLAHSATEVVSNGSFESGLTGWSVGEPTPNPGTPTCGWNVVTSVVNESVTNTAGFTASDGTKVAQGGLIQTTAATSPGSSCVIYQDVLIPNGATTGTLSFDSKVNANGGKSTGSAAIFVGLYSTSAIPNYLTAVLIRFGTVSPTTVSGALASVSRPSVNLSAYAGQTLRLAFIVASDSTIGNATAGLDKISLLVNTASPQTIAFGAAPTPTFNPSTPFTVSATASSGLPVAFTSLTTGVCTVASSAGNTATVNMVSTGTCTIAADQAGDSTYAAAAQVTQDVTIQAAAPESIPTLSEWAMLLLASLMSIFAIARMRRNG